MWLVALIPGAVTWALMAAVGNALFGCEPFARIFAAMPAVWVSWFVWDKLEAREYSFLHPQVYKYNLSKREVFERLLSYLSQTTHKYGRPWIQQLVDAEKENKIVYHIAWTEEKVDFSLDTRTGLREKHSNVKLWVQLHMYIEPLATGSTAVQITWSYQAEALPDECKVLIALTTNEIQTVLGPGIALPTILHRQTLSPEVPAYATAAIALLMLLSLFNAVFPAHGEQVGKAEDAVSYAKNSYADERAKYLKELREWRDHKRFKPIREIQEMTSSDGSLRSRFGEALND